MSTIHLFDDSRNQDNNLLGDLAATITIQELMLVPFAERDEQWRMDFLVNLPTASLQLADPELVVGPDGFPYLQLITAEKDKNYQAFVIQNRNSDYILTNGFGVVINAHLEQPDWVLTYGDLANLSLNNEFYTDESLFSKETAEQTIDKDEKVLVGAPSEIILPKAVRAALREYLEYQGITNPKVMLIARDYESETTARQDLVFNITPQQFRKPEDFQALMEHIGWFLPRHYSYMGLDELAVNGFNPL
ncbi:hypothetical protein J5U18_09995 [Sphingobacteriaceae bacterium WQ 2009]|uniref:Uncharacterized protein n=1 Tax=Rhinopithecimicrobium faecis TaxID=2820698 RepID=A0A8T4HAV8_9SPHI|nr:hypothetical protein [Sphingobacteriaceae bacterium WQ 2009]